jgi:hypothetical protein
MHKSIEISIQFVIIGYLDMWYYSFIHYNCQDQGCQNWDFDSDRMGIARLQNLKSQPKLKESTPLIL